MKVLYRPHPSGPSLPLAREGGDTTQRQTPEHLNARTPERPNAGFWNGSLSYPQSALVVATAIAIGLFFHARIGYGLRVPLDWIEVGSAGSILAIAFAARRWQGHPVVRWLTGIPFAISSLIGVGILAGVGAVVSSATLEARFGLSSIYSSWPFLMALLTMLVNLIGVTSKRCWPLTYVNICFTLSHLGLTLAILGGLLSATGLERANLLLYGGRPEHIARRADDSAFVLPFRATLKQFTLERFPPTLALATEDKKQEGGFVVMPGHQFVRAGMREQIGTYSIEVKRFWPRAAQVGDQWKEVRMKTCAPAAFITAYDSEGKPVGEGWVSCGSPDTSGAVLPVSAKQAIYMPVPRPKEYRSLVSIERDGRGEMREIRVNHPVSIGSYRLYQLSYDEKMGEASEYSVIEVVRDKGLPLVYLGMFLVLGGAMMMLWNGSKSTPPSRPPFPPMLGGQGGGKGAGGLGVK